MLGIERVGHIVLRVSDVETSVAFYRDVLGMEVNSYRPGQGAFLSFGHQHHDIGLFQAKGKTRGELGMAHLALRIAGDDSDLRAAYDKLKAAGAQITNVTDHGMTHSVYFLDPDGNTLEVYTDVYEPAEGIEVMRTKTNMRQPLDIEAIPTRA
jgi:catechol 2,3-dioxygenase